MKKIISLSLLLTIFSIAPVSLVHAADEAPVSAPNVVAPAQPAAPQAPSTNGTTAAAPTAAQAQQPGLLQMAMPFVIMLGILYFLMIRPQQKKMKEHQNLVSALKTGDEVVTSAGIIGVIAGMNDKVVTLEVSKNVQMKVLRSQVNQVVKGQIQDIQPNA